MRDVDPLRKPFDFREGVECEQCGGSGSIPAFIEYKNRRGGLGLVECPECIGFGIVEKRPQEWGEKGMVMKLLRIKKNMTLHDRAAQLGISIAELSRAERGRCDPSPYEFQSTPAESERGMTTEELKHALEKQADVFNVRDCAFGPGPTQHLLRLAASRLRELHEAQHSQGMKPISQFVAPDIEALESIDDDDQQTKYLVRVDGVVEIARYGVDDTLVGWFNHLDYRIHPTHFMPLPEGPK